MDDAMRSGDPRSRELKGRIEDARHGLHKGLNATLAAAPAPPAYKNAVVEGVIDRIGIRGISSNWENTRSDITHAFTLEGGQRRIYVVKGPVTSDALALARSGDAVRFEIARDGGIVNFLNKTLG